MSRFIEIVKQEDGDLTVFGYIDGAIVKTCTIQCIDWPKVNLSIIATDYQQWMTDLIISDWHDDLDLDYRHSESLQEILDLIRKVNQETPAEAYDRAMGVIGNVSKTTKKDPVVKDPSAPVEQRPLAPEEIEQRKAYDRAMRGVA